jgi:nucleotide-binding universal stress UspA family protein
VEQRSSIAAKTFYKIGEFMKIILSTDGSDFSKAAIEFCRNVIFDSKTTSLKIISAVENPTPITAEPYAMSAEFYGQIVETVNKRAREYVEQAKLQVDLLFPEGFKEVSVEVIAGSPEQVIVETAESWGADLIIVGSHGYGFWSRALIGSVSNSIVNHAPCSVLVVRTKK